MWISHFSKDKTRMLRLYSFQKEKDTIILGERLKRKRQHKMGQRSTKFELLTSSNSNHVIVNSEMVMYMKIVLV